MTTRKRSTKKAKSIRIPRWEFLPARVGISVARRKVIKVGEAARPVPFALLSGAHGRTDKEARGQSPISSNATTSAGVLLQCWSRAEGDGFATEGRVFSPYVHT